MAFTTVDALAAQSPGSISVAHVEPAELSNVWNDCALGIGQALVEYMPGALTIEDCRKLCEHGQNQLWLARDGGKIVGGAITEVIVQPQGLAIRLFLTDYAAPWSPYLTSTIEEWASLLGATTIVVVGPPGLQAMLGKPITTYWRRMGGPLRDVPQPAIAMPSERVH
jgi:hypothetical protein